MFVKYHRVLVACLGVKAGYGRLCEWGGSHSLSVALSDGKDVFGSRVLVAAKLQWFRVSRLPSRRFPGNRTTDA